MLGTIGESNPGQCCRSPLIIDAAGIPHTKLHICQCRKLGQQVIGLEDKADFLSSNLRQLTSVKATNLSIIQVITTRGRNI